MTPSPTPPGWSTSRSDMESIYAELTRRLPPAAAHRRARLRGGRAVPRPSAEPRRDRRRARAAAEGQAGPRDRPGHVRRARARADPRAGFHLIHSMSQPTAAALARLEEFRARRQRRPRPDARRPRGRHRPRDDPEPRLPQLRGRRRRPPRSRSRSTSCCSTTPSASASCAAAPATHPSTRAGASSAPASTSRTSTRARSRSSSSCSSASSARSRRCTAATISGAFDEPRAREPAREAVDRGRRQLRDRRCLPVAARHGLRDRRDGLVLRRCRRARRGSSPAAPICACRAFVGERVAAPGALLQPRVPGREPGGPDARRRGGAGRRDGRGRPQRGLGGDQRRDDQPRRPTARRCARRRSRSTSSAAT